MGSLVGRDELRRLQKAARENDKGKLADWLNSFEQQMNELMRRDYENAYQEEVYNTVENTLTAIVYALYFSEETYINKSNLGEFMSDLFVTLDMFRTGEYRPEDYEKELAEEKITMDKYDCDKIYKKYLNIFDDELVKYIKGKHRKLITICGNTKFRDDILQVARDLTIQGNLIFTKDVYMEFEKDKIFGEELKQVSKMHKEKILLSDSIFVVNINNEIDDITKSEIEYAKKHNKEIKYLIQSN